MSDDKDRIILGQRYSAVLNNISDESLSQLAAALEGDLRDAFAKIVGLPSSAFDDEVTLGARARDAMARRRSWHDAGIVLAEPCTQYSIEKLGDASEDPSLEELQALLPEVVEKFGLDAVKLMVVQYSRSLKGFRQLVASDERFLTSGTTAGATQVLERDEAVQAAKRALRKERRDREKLAKGKSRR